jgi:hypothetical protein
VNGGDRAEPAGLEVLECLHDLDLGVHHERAGPGDRLADRLPAEDEQFRRGVPRVLPVSGADGDRVARAEDRELSGGHRPVVGADRRVASKDVDQRVEVLPPRQRQRAARRDRRVDHRHRRVGRAGAGVTGDLAGDHPHQRRGVLVGQQGDPIGPQVLVAGLDQLLGPREVDPQLQAVEEPAARDERLRRLLDVQDSAAGGHPLGVPVGDDATAAVAVGVLERPVDDVGHRLEPAVRMPGRALGLTRRVLHLAHLVEVDERVQVGQVDPREGAADGEALALVALRRGRDLADRARTGVERGADAGQEGDVVDGNGRHGWLPVIGWAVQQTTT